MPAARTVPLSEKKKSPAMIYGIAGAAAVVLIGGLLLWQPWKQSGPAVPDGQSMNDGRAGRPAHSSAAALKLLGNVFTNSVGAEMVYIPPGEFMMGSTKEEQAWAVAGGLKEEYAQREGEAPRKATIKRGFWIGRTEVTVGQWKQFVKETAYKTDAEKKGYADGAPRKDQPWSRMDGLSWRDPGFGSPPQDNHPASCISWSDAVAFCEWLTERERKRGRLAAGQVVRLPTEAEWEYACRAGTQTKFWWSENKEDGKDRLNWLGKDDGFEWVAPVDSFGFRGRNGFGLADMLGNVREWCLDDYDAAGAHEGPYKGGPGRVLRGGSFDNASTAARCVSRTPNDPGISSSDYGFRVVVGVDVSRALTATASTSPAAATQEAGVLAPTETRVTALTTTPKIGEVYTLNVGSNVAMELMGIPPGEFMLGSTKEEQAWAVANKLKEEEAKREGEAPRKAAIKHGFWMGRTEVTVGQWRQFVKDTGYLTDGEKKGQSYVPQPGKSVPKKGVSWRNPDFRFEMQDDHPVSCISWDDAVAFCGWQTEQERKAGRLPTGMVVRLPTEAEWEYACRAGRQTKFWWGDSKEDGKGRLNWNGKDDGFEFVAPVDSCDVRGRNRFGLADMLGNVYEWCLDEYDATQAHEDLWTGNPDARVLRGESFTNTPAGCRCASRSGSAPSGSSSSSGFRVAVGPAR